MGEIETTVLDIDPQDEGVDQRFKFNEEFVKDGEQVERVTNAQLLEGGGVCITQNVQGLIDVVTITQEVLDHINKQQNND